MLARDDDGHRLHVIQAHAVIAAGLADRLDGRMREIAGGVIFEQGALDRHPAPGVQGRGECIGRRGLRACKALLALDGVRVRREATRRKLGRHQPVHGRLAGVQRLGHGAEHALQAGCLRGREAQCMRGRGGVKLAQRRARRGGTERADGAGDVESLLVVAGAKHFADPAFNLMADDQRAQQRPSAGVLHLGLGQRSRRHRHRRVPVHGRGNIIEIQRMARRAVDQRGLERIRMGRPAQQAAGQVARAGILLRQHLHQRFVGGRQAD
ncbi:hypothetical protein D9M70_491210 [compost metagenome]